MTAIEHEVWCIVENELEKLYTLEEIKRATIKYDEDTRLVTVLMNNVVEYIEVVVNVVPPE